MRDSVSLNLTPFHPQCDRLLAQQGWPVRLSLWRDHAVLDDVLARRRRAT